MRHIARRLASWTFRDEGQDLMEYGLLASLIAIAAIGAVDLAGNAIKNVFDVIATDFPTF